MAGNCDNLLAGGQKLDKSWGKYEIFKLFKYNKRSKKEHHKSR